jgi:hypothetical protein
MGEFEAADRFVGCCVRLARARGKREEPQRGYRRVARELNVVGINLSATSVRKALTIRGNTARHDCSHPRPRTRRGSPRRPAYADTTSSADSSANTKPLQFREPHAIDAESGRGAA